MMLFDWTEAADRRDLLSEWTRQPVSVTSAATSCCWSH